jgi:hypothetical protein
VLAHSVFIGKVFAGKRLVHDHYLGGLVVIPLAEIPSLQHGDVQGLEEAWGGNLNVRRRLF